MATRSNGVVDADTSLARSAPPSFAGVVKSSRKNKKVLQSAGCQIGSRSTTSKASLDKTGYAVG